MGNLWGFLLQTIAVSIIAGVLLIVKRLLEDKLSPRWQYGVWSVLALRILLPVSTGSYMLPQIPLWMEVWKASAERGLNSVYSSAYVPVGLRHVFPVLCDVPRSITDWLFAVYAVGIAMSAVWYLIAYCRLRLLLRKGEPASEAVQGRIRTVCERYGLKPCRTVAVAGLDSAFICGVFRPVLAVPANRDLDDKVFLHELLHKRHLDALQSIFLCFLRCLHWCNPFLQWVFDRIGNDMESLCDQRVLERLEGEERREYGRILLDMANARYARTPGTTSISNGGKQIARRIGAIVRFKKYPRGMALVSVCMVIALGCPAIAGSAASFGQALYTPVNLTELEQAMAMTRLNRCTTVAGALDTYAKSLMLHNGIYLATVSPLEAQEALDAEMRDNAARGEAAYWIDSGYGLAASDFNGYRIYNLKAREDGGYDAILLFGVNFFENVQQIDEGNEGGSVAVPVTARYTDAWVVEETGARTLYTESLDFAEEQLPKLWEKTVEAQTGVVTVGLNALYRVDTEAVSGDGVVWSDTGFDTTLLPNAEFSSVMLSTNARYSCLPNAAGQEPETSVGIQMKWQDSIDRQAVLTWDVFREGLGGVSSTGEYWESRQVDESWDGTVILYGGTSVSDSKGLEPATLPGACRVRLFWDGAMVEELTIPVAE